MVVQLVALADVPRRTDGAVEGERTLELFVGLAPAPLARNLLACPHAAQCL
jgi:hypothetical protein